MAHNVDGVALVGTGVGTITGYIVTEVSESESGGETPITDEIGNFVSEVNNFGISTQATINVIAKSGTATPAINDLFPYTSKTYGAVTMRIKTLDAAEAPTDAVKWVISGKRYPGFTPS